MKHICVSLYYRENCCNQVSTPVAGATQIRQIFQHLNSSASRTGGGSVIENPQR